MAGFRFSVHGTGLQAIVRVLEAVAQNRERSSAFLALQLSFFEMSALGCGLMCPAPE